MVPKVFAEVLLQIISPWDPEPVKSMVPDVVSWPSALKVPLLGILRVPAAEIVINSSAVKVFAPMSK